MNKVKEFKIIGIKVLQQSIKKTIQILLISDRTKAFLKQLSKIFLSLSEKTLWVYIICIILPRAIAAIMFFLDICIFHYFYYFYKILPILLLPLMMNWIIYMFKYWSEQIFEELSKIVTVDYNRETQIFKMAFKEGKEKKYPFKDIYVFQYMYDFSLRLANFEYNFEENADKPGILIFKCLINMLFIISWMYMITKNIIF